MSNLSLVLDECVFYLRDGEIYQTKNNMRVAPIPNRDGVPTAYGFVATCKIVVPYDELLEALKAESFDEDGEDGDEDGLFGEYE